MGEREKTEDRINKMCIYNNRLFRRRMIKSRDGEYMALLQIVGDDTLVSLRLNPVDSVFPIVVIHGCDKC